MPHSPPLRLRLKRAALAVCRAMGLFAVARHLTRGAVRILGYHGTWRVADDYPGDAMFIRAETFARRLDTLAAEYRVVRLQQAVRALRMGRPVADRAVVITIDDGWLGTYEDMLPALEARGLPATLYCDTAHLQAGTDIPHVAAQYLRRVSDIAHPQRDSTHFGAATDLTRSLAEREAALTQYADALHAPLASWLASGTFRYMTPAQLADAWRRGLDVQLHTHNHSLHDFSPARIAEEVAANRTALHDMLGVDPQRLVHFCYPSGVTNSAAHAPLDAAGVKSATTTDAGLAWPGDAPFAMPRFLDGDNVSALEFEAWMSGFVDCVRSPLYVLRQYARLTLQEWRTPRPVDVVMDDGLTAETPAVASARESAAA